MVRRKVNQNFRLFPHFRSIYMHTHLYTTATICFQTKITQHWISHETTSCAVKSVQRTYEIVKHVYPRFSCFIKAFFKQKKISRLQFTQHSFISRSEFPICSVTVMSNFIVESHEIIFEISLFRYVYNAERLSVNFIRECYFNSNKVLYILWSVAVFVSRVSFMCHQYYDMPQYTVSFPPRHMYI